MTPSDTSQKHMVRALAQRTILSSPLPPRGATTAFNPRSESSKPASLVSIASANITAVKYLKLMQYYSATLFKPIGFNQPTAVGLIVAGTNFLFTFVALKYIDIIGRRKIMIFTPPGMIFVLTLASISFYYLTKSTGGVLVDGTDYPKTWSSLILFSMVFYVASYATGLGNIPWQKESLSPALQQWEEAGTLLAGALNSYLDLCSSLYSNARREGVHPKEIATRIDSVLGSLHVTIDRQTSKTRITLTQTRNQIMSRINAFPNEVLSEIFANTIYAPANQYLISMTDRLVGIYRSTHRLLAVCTVWRDVVLSRGSFWSIIPILRTEPSYFNFGYPQATNLSLERARHADLHLVAIQPDIGCEVPDLVQYAPQFSSINIACKYRSTISDILSSFWDLGASTRLSDISLHREPTELPHYGLPQSYDYIFPPNSLEQTSFEEILKNLSVLRLRGAQCYWDTIAFSDRLVELCLQDICLGYDSMMAKVIMSLSAATGLRDLKLISVKTFPDRVMEQSLMTGTRISLPSLQSLLVRDLYANTLDFFLSSIMSRSHQLVLHLTEKTLQVIRPGESGPEDGVEVDDVAGLFSGLSVNILLIDGEDGMWMTSTELQALMSSMPDLKTLKMNYWDYEDDHCEALTRGSESGSFPQLKNISITCARIWDAQTFRAM
ncbi:unnamed protein product, partial [Rhizoctonia solani]